jgi:hypothetical protein
MTSCSALVGNGSPAIITTNTAESNMIYLRYKNNTIIDNIHVNGNNIRTYGFVYSNSNNNTINNSQSYNNTGYGFVITNAGYNTINNSQVYNNGSY